MVAFPLQACVNDNPSSATVRIRVQSVFPYRQSPSLTITVPCDHVGFSEKTLNKMSENSNHAFLTIKMCKKMSFYWIVIYRDEKLGLFPLSLASLVLC